jgi:hypothetical protein
LRANSLLRPAAASDGPSPQAQVLRPDTAYQGNCDLNGFGFGGF